jgi:hypothetical protein
MVFLWFSCGFPTVFPFKPPYFPIDLTVRSMVMDPRATLGRRKDGENSWKIMAIYGN